VFLPLKIAGESLLEFTLLIEVIVLLAPCLDFYRIYCFDSLFSRTVALSPVNDFP